MTTFWLRFGEWAWDLLSGIQPLIDWLFDPITIAGVVDVAPIYLIGGGAFAGTFIIGILRAIL